jgi:hypothetical protein
VQLKVLMSLQVGHGVGVAPQPSSYIAKVMEMVVVVVEMVEVIIEAKIKEIGKVYSQLTGHVYFQKSKRKNVCFLRMGGTLGFCEKI